MQPADIPAIGNPSLRPGGIRAPWPGFSLIPCTVTRDQLRRKGDRPRAAGTTHGDASTTAIRKTLSAAEADIQPERSDA